MTKKLINFLFIILLVVTLSPCAIAQIVDQGQRQDSTNTQGQKQNTVINFSSKQKSPVARASAYAPPDTAPCNVGIGAGVQTFGAGVSLTGSTESEECNRRKNAFAAAALGMIDMARSMRIIDTCEDKRYKGMKECIELYTENDNVIESTNCKYPTQPECKRLHR